MKAKYHENDVIMGAIASQIMSLTIVYSIVYSDTDQRKHQSSASLAFVWGIHRGPVNSPHKWPVTRKMFSFDDVIMHFRNSAYCWCFGVLRCLGTISLNHIMYGNLRQACGCPSVSGSTRNNLIYVIWIDRELVKCRRQNEAGKAMSTFYGLYYAYDSVYLKVSRHPTALATSMCTLWDRKPYMSGHC